MKKLMPLLLCILLLAGCAETYDGPTTAEPRLTEYTTDHYYQFFGWDEMHNTTRSVYAYDIYGNLVREMGYRDGELETVTNYRYDEEGREISRTDWDHTGWLPKFERRVEQTYDSQGRLLSHVACNFWGIQIGGSFYSYDDEARTRTWKNDIGDIQTTWFDEDGNEIRQVAGIYETVYQYDDRGNRTGWQSYENGVPGDSYVARYDGQDRQIWGGRYDPAGNLTSETTYVYDDEQNTMTYLKNDGGKRIEYSHPDGRLHMIEDYNADGRLTLLQRYYYRDIQVPAKEE